MKAWSLLLAGCLAGCDEKAPVVKREPPPVVRMAPVETRPFEDGYNAGHALGIAQGKPGAKIPPETEVEPLGRAQADQAPERTERWQRGFVEGYLDGFRKVATGQR